MNNADIFTCVMCRGIVEVQNGNQDVAVVYDNITEGWRIICDTCVVRCQAVVHPFMIINYALLKEKPSGKQPN